MTTYCINERSMGGFATETEARRMAELLVARGYTLVYGFGDNVIKGIGDLLAARGFDGFFDPRSPIVIAPDMPLSIPAATCIDWDECIDILSEERFPIDTMPEI